jgi:hypothetical protein
MEHLPLGDLFYFVEKNHFIEEQCALSIFRGLLHGTMHLHSNFHALPKGIHPRCSYFYIFKV